MVVQSTVIIDWLLIALRSDSDYYHLHPDPLLPICTWLNPASRTTVGRRGRRLGGAELQGFKRSKLPPQVFGDRDEKN